MDIKLDPADVRVSVLNLIVVGMLALVFIAAGKVITARFNVPGLRELFAMA